MNYIQSNTERTLAHHFDASCALYGAIDNGEKYRLTSFEEVASGKFDALIKDNLFVGSTEFMREVFKRVGITDVHLPMNANRPCSIITLGEAYNRVKNGIKLFIKPVEIKLFTGLILDGSRYSSLNGLPHDTKVMAYEPFTSKILSEWRCYIDKNEIVDIRNYSGDFFIVPDKQYLFDVINKNKSTFPCSYTIDIGILSYNENVVIEFNDMWAIGNYGMANDDYLQLLKNRYFEIHRDFAKLKI